MRKFFLLSAMAGLFMVGLVMVGCNNDGEEVASFDPSHAVMYNASANENAFYDENIFQEKNSLALELTGYSYEEISNFHYVPDRSTDENALDEPGFKEATASGHWYCWVLLMGCLMGCDQNHGGSQCEDVCFRGFNSCGGGTQATHNIVN